MIFVPPLWVVLLWGASALVASLAFATAMAIVARRFRYGGMPRPAEWLAILIAAAMLGLALPNVDEAVNWSRGLSSGFSGSLDRNYSLFRWAWAGVATVVALVGLARARRGPTMARRPGSRRSVLTGVATALLWGPIPVCSLELPWMIWGPALAAGEVPGAMFNFWLEVRKGIARLPLGLLFGVPIVATVRDRLRSDRPAWRWTEWVGAASAGWLALIVFGFWLLELNWAERLAASLWLAAVVSVSRLIARGSLVGSRGRALVSERGTAL